VALNASVGHRAAAGLAAIGFVYAVILVIGIAQAGPDRPIVDPVLAVMEVLTLLSAPAVILLFVAVQEEVAPGRRMYARVALAFAVLMAGLTSSVHFVSLTWARQVGSSLLQWPSPWYALELLSWDVFLGLALLFAAPIFGGSTKGDRARLACMISGVLCLFGIIGPLMGKMEIQRIGIVGYGVGFPVSCAIIASVFRNGDGWATRRTGAGPTAGSA
jgi:hypothetical protein